MTRAPRLSLTGLHVVLAATAAAAVASASAVGAVAARADSHSHHSATPMAELNETDILLYHAPDSESYFDHDFAPLSSSPHGLVAAHVLLMCLAYWVILPASIALRIAHHPGRIWAICAFHIINTLGLFSGNLYNKLTPDLYAHSKHGALGYVMVAASIAITLWDAAGVLGRLAEAFRGRDKVTVASLYRALWPSASTRGYSSVAAFVDEPLQEAQLKAFDDPNVAEHGQLQSQYSQYSDGWISGRSTFEESARSDLTLHDAHGDVAFDSGTKAARPPYYSAAAALFTYLERVLVIMAFTQFLSGVVVYTGRCQGNYLNGCMAHLIKGGIFWCYGLLSFARFLGVYADKGWAWNRTSTIRAVSFEFVECFVLFLYGVTNTWMERFGAAPDSPYTSKQVQHISIAVMFWFGGLVGMAMESPRFRQWLNVGAVVSAPTGGRLHDFRSSTISFNPIPAIIIGITGTAMSAHHQTYVFQVAIHALWGNFLVGFAVLRSLTYFLLWLRPPSSLVPSRPPTELVASFLLSCGGITFIFSTEQVTFAAMRRGHDDVMMFMNVSVALTFVAFCWILFFLSFKGWITSRR